MRRFLIMASNGFDDLPIRTFEREDAAREYAERDLASLHADIDRVTSIFNRNRRETESLVLCRFDDLNGWLFKVEAVRTF